MKYELLKKELKPFEVVYDEHNKNPEYVFRQV